MVRIGNHDLMVLDRGKQRSEGEKRFLVIVDDEGINFTNGAGGGATDVAKEYMASLLDNEAYKHGAVEVVRGSECVRGGNKDIYGDDMVKVYNAGEGVLFMDEELKDILVRHKLAKLENEAPKGEK